jgi:tetratricopeptide (TPR) repeat protein
MYEAVKAVHGEEAAADRVKSAIIEGGIDGDLCWAAADAMEEDEGAVGAAIELLRHAHAEDPEDTTVMGRLGTLLSKDALTRDEGVRFLRMTLEESPGWADGINTLAIAIADESPEEALALLDTVEADDDEELMWCTDTRAMILDRLGRKKEAEKAARRALAYSGLSPAGGANRLAHWHSGENRYERALYWAKRMVELPGADDDPDDFLDTLIQVHRLAGRGAEIMDRVRARCKRGVPYDVAWEVYYLCSGEVDPALAAKAAKVLAKRADDEEEWFEWLTHEATSLARLGDRKPLDELRRRAGKRAERLALLSHFYDELEIDDVAIELGNRAFALQPNSPEVLTAYLEAKLLEGDSDAALAAARTLSQRSPYQHQGPERVGMICAQRFERDEALAASERAVKMAPYCNLSHASRSLALFVNEQWDGALAHARQALALNQMDPAKDANDSDVMMIRALAGDVVGLERCFALMKGANPYPAFDRFLREVATSRRPSVTKSAIQGA